MWEEICDKRKN
jgi:hypothetical protein